MQTVTIVWNLLSLLSLLAVPQLLGVLAYFSFKRYRYVGQVAGVIIPPVAFFYLSQVLLGSEAREIQARGQIVCGTSVAMLIMGTLMVTTLQLVFSTVAQLILHQRYKTKAMIRDAQTNE